MSAGDADDLVDAPAVASWADAADHHVSAVSLARIEGKIDVALTGQRARIAEHDRRLVEQAAALLGLTDKLTELATAQAVTASQLATVAASVNEQRREHAAAGTRWPAATSAIVAAVALLLLVAERLYGA